MNVTVRVSDSIKENGLFSTKNIKKDEIILTENPLVCCQFSWNKLYGYKACDHCLRPLETVQENAVRLTGNRNIIVPYPEYCSTNLNNITCCDNCGVEYCSPQCLTDAFEQYHKALCLGIIQNKDQLNLLEETWRNTHYPPETNTIMLIVRLLARIVQAPNREEMIKETLQFCHRSKNDDLQLTHKLMGEKFIVQINEIKSLLQQIFPQPELQQFFGDNFCSLLALIGTNGQGVATSAISQWVKKVSDLPLPSSEKEKLDKLIDKLYEDIDAHSGSFLDNEGVALFYLQSKCNHSCAPNAQVNYTNNNFQLSLVALQDIEAGEEIFISYLDECSISRSRHSRQKELMENYLFVCNCVKCIEQIDDEDVTSEEEMDDENEDEMDEEDMG